MIVDNIENNELKITPVAIEKKKWAVFRDDKEILMIYRDASQYRPFKDIKKGTIKLYCSKKTAISSLMKSDWYVSENKDKVIIEDSAIITPNHTYKVVLVKETILFINEKPVDKSENQLPRMSGSN